MSIEARQIQETLYSYAAILNFTPSLQGLRAKFGACSVQNAQLLTEITKYANLRTHARKIINNYFKYTNTRCNAIEYRSFYLVVLLLAGSSRF